MPVKWCFSAGSLWTCPFLSFKISRRWNITTAVIDRRCCGWIWENVRAVRNQTQASVQGKRWNWLERIVLCHCEHLILHRNQLLQRSLEKHFTYSILPLWELEHLCLPCCLCHKRNRSMYLFHEPLPPLSTCVTSMSEFLLWPVKMMTKSRCPHPWRDSEAFTCSCYLQKRCNVRNLALFIRQYSHWLKVWPQGPLKPTGRVGGHESWKFYVNSSETTCWRTVGKHACKEWWM